MLDQAHVRSCCWSDGVTRVDGASGCVRTSSTCAGIGVFSVAKQGRSFSTSVNGLASLEPVTNVGVREQHPSRDTPLMAQV